MLRTNKDIALYSATSTTTAAAVKNTERNQQNDSVFTKWKMSVYFSQLVHKNEHRFTV